jgi:hypothetical protein
MYVCVACVCVVCVRVCVCVCVCVCVRVRCVWTVLDASEEWMALEVRGAVLRTQPLFDVRRQEGLLCGETRGSAQRVYACV